MKIFVLFVWLCTGYSVDQCEPAHIESSYATKQLCTDAALDLRTKAAKQGIIALPVCGEVTVEGRDA